MEFPTELFYTADHMWIRFEGSTATIGLSAYFADEHAVMALVSSNASYVSVGSQLFELVDIGGASFTFDSPVVGDVSEYNDNAMSRLTGQWIENPYGDDWMVKITLSNPSARTAAMLTAAQYRAKIGK
jgi:glycine cleavage system H protein